MLRVITAAIAASAILAFTIPVQAEQATLLKTIQKPDPTAGAEFGSAVTITPASHILIGAPRSNSGDLNSGSAYLYDVEGTLLRTLHKATPGRDDRFGSAVAAVGTIVAAGVPFDDTGGENTGAVVLFDEASGALRQTLRSNTPIVNAHFGFSLATTDGGLVIGAPNDDVVDATNVGSVYVYTIATGALRRIPNPALRGDDFGWAVATVGAVIAVGAPDALGVGGAVDAGAVYLFDANGTLLKTLLGAAAGDGFGTSLAAAGLTLAVGAPQANADGRNVGSGEVVVFDANPASATFGQPLRTLTEDPVAGGNRFGQALAGRGPDVLVSSPHARVSTVDEAGSVYLINAAGGGVVAPVPNPEPGRNDQFGGGNEKNSSRPLARPALAAKGGLLVVGAPLDDRGGLDDSGTVYFYRAPLPPGGTYCVTNADCDDGVVTNGAELCIAFECHAGTPPPPPPDCNDDDACTTDVLETSGACSHTPKAGYAAIDCRLSQIEGIISSNTGAFRGPFVSKVNKTTAKTRAMLSSAEQTAGSRARRQVGKIGAQMTAFGKLIRRKAKVGRVEAAVAGKLTALSDGIVDVVPTVKANIR